MFPAVIAMTLIVASPSPVRFIPAVPGLTPVNLEAVPLPIIHVVVTAAVLSMSRMTTMVLTATMIMITIAVATMTMAMTTPGDPQLGLRRVFWVNQFKVNFALVLIHPQ